MRTPLSLRCAGAPALLLALVSASSAFAAELAPDTLTLILQELRQLRRSVELTALLQVKVQVAAERLKLREPQVRALAERAAHAEEAQTASTVEIERTQAELAKVEERMGQETAAEVQPELAAKRRALADTLGHMSRQQEEAHRRAEALAASLAAERGELERLSEALGELERSLERHVHASGVAEPPSR